MKLNLFRKPRFHQQVRNAGFISEFVQSVKKQVQDNEKFKQDIQQLSDEQAKVTESDAMKNAKQALTATSQATTKVFETLGSAVDATMNTTVVRATGEAIAKTAEVTANITHAAIDPILETKAAKKVASGISQIQRDVMGQRNAYFAGYRPKEERELERSEMMMDRQKRNPVDQHGMPSSIGPTDRNDDATGVTLHRSGVMAGAWEKFKAESALGQSIHSYKLRLDQSDSSVMQFWRRLNEKTTFSETESSRVVKAFKTVDAEFDQHVFLTEAAHYMIADILEAYLKGDSKVLKEWGTEAAFARLSADFAAQTKAGFVSACQLIDYRNVELSKMTLLNDEVPIIYITFQTTEILCFKNKAGEIVLGAEDNIQNARYGIAFTKNRLLDPEAEFKELTNDWIIIDWARSA